MSYSRVAGQVSRYSYVPKAPRSTIWDYNFSNSKVSTDTHLQDKQQNFSFVPKTENKPEASTAEKVRLGPGDGRQSRPRSKKDEDERKHRIPLKLPSWQHNRTVSNSKPVPATTPSTSTQTQRRPSSASGVPPRASPELLSPLSSPPPLKSCLKPENRTNSLGRSVRLRSYSPATPSKYNVNFKPDLGKYFL